MMHDSDDRLREQLQQAWRRKVGDDAPSFDSVWHAAASRRAATRRRRRWIAAAAAVAVAAVFALYQQAPRQEMHYIEVAELLDTTYWSAPSDVLLPDREFDIYQDMPVLFESTEPAEGALL